MKNAGSTAKGMFYVDDSSFRVGEAGRLLELRKMAKMLGDHHAEIWDGVWDGYFDVSWRKYMG